MKATRSASWMTLAFLSLLAIATTGRARATGAEHINVPDPEFPVLLTVGSDAACDYDDLDTAIADSARFGAAQHVLRIAMNYAHVVRSTVFDRSLYLEGGYATCSSAQISGRTELQGAGVDNLFDLFESDGGSYEIVLDGLTLFGGGGSSGGAVIVSGDGMTLRLRDVEVRDNTVSHFGGGVYVHAATLILEEGTTLLRNSAFRGGGVYCEEGEVEFLQGAISFNQVQQGQNQQTAQGGGIFAQECRIEASAGGPFSGITFNAAQSGGGIFATMSNVILRGTTGHAAEVFSNTAGNGIVATNSTISLKNASISGNVGSGIHVASSLLLMDRSDDCHDDDRCSQVSGNSGDGVVVFNSFAAILQTYIEGNSSAVRVVDTTDSTTLILSNSILANNSSNGGPEIFASGGDLDLYQSTIVGERRDRGLISGFVDHLDLRNTLLWRQSPAGVGAAVFPILVQGPVELDCGIFDSTSNPGGNISGIRVFEQDPRFVDLAGGDYHLRADSPAIDRCEPLTPPERDIDRQERGFDLVGAGDPPFPDDIGADEFHLGVITGPPQAIFANGFESGDLTSWQ